MSIAIQKIKIIDFLKRILIVCAVVGITIVPIFRMALFLGTTGANNPSNDEWPIIGIIDQVLSNEYQWKNLFRDSFINGHSVVLPLLVQIGAAYLIDYNIYGIIFFGIVLAVFKLFLLQRIFSHSIKSHLNLLLWPIIAGLVFSASQLSVFEFVPASLQMGLSTLGLILGLFGLVRFSGNWLGTLLMVIGGFMASWSWGGGPVVWPVFLVGSVLFNFRRIFHYLIWLLAGISASMPYLYFIIFNKSFSLNTQKFIPFNFAFIVQSIGWPFAQHFSSQIAISRGVVGLIMGLLGIFFFLYQKNKQALRQAAPGLLLIIYSLLNIWQISSVRSNLGLAPWYSTPFVIFWIGLVDLGFVGGVHWRTAQLPMRMWCLSLFGLLLFFYFTSNITYTDKSFYLQARSPSSASCLRHYDQAPTYCEQTLFLWPPGNYQLISKLGNPLERHSISTFGPHQRWTLQGDLFLDNVRIYQDKTAPKVIWTEDLNPEPLSFRDYRHLNLLISPPNSVSWDLMLPSNIKKAVFHSAAAINNLNYEKDISDGVIFRITIKREGQSDKIVLSRHLKLNQKTWISFEIPLTQYAGEHITLILSTSINGNPNNVWPFFHFPYLDVFFKSEKEFKEKEIRPLNTELNPLFPKISETDFQFPINNTQDWTISEMTPFSQQEVASRWVMEKNPNMKYKKPLELCLADYTHIYFSISVAPSVHPRTALVVLHTNDPLSPRKTIYVPLLSDGNLHEYTYDLRLLEFEQSTRLVGLEYYPLTGVEPSNENLVQLGDLRLLKSKNDQVSICNNRDQTGLRQ